MTTCPVCQGGARKWIQGTTTGTEFFASAGEYRIAKGEGEDYLPVWICGACGHGFTPIDFDPRMISAWYAKAEADENFLAGEPGRRLTARKILQRIENLTGSYGRLLDVGAGPGFFLDEAKNRGWKVAGLEPAAWAAAYARDKLGMADMKTGDTQALEQFPENHFDVVTSFDVIEHVSDPGEFAKKLARVVKKGGYLVLTTPRFDSLLSRLMGEKWYCIFPAHLHYFTRASLTRVLDEAGFIMVETRSHVRYLGWRYWLQRLLVHIGLADGADAVPPSAPIPINYGDEFEVYAQKR